MLVGVLGHSLEHPLPLDPTSPWSAFGRALASRGHLIRPIESGTPLDGLDAWVGFSHEPQLIRGLDACGVPISRRVLAVWEPRVVSPHLYRQRALSCYAHVFAPSPEWAREVNGVPFPWPQSVIDSPLEPADAWMKRANACVLVNANKFSAVRGEMYSLRRRALARLDSHGIPVDVVGPRWESPFSARWYHWSASAKVQIASLAIPSCTSASQFMLRPKNIMGEVLDKAEICSRYRIALVIENAPDFVSEKAFDASGSGCIVIYCGPELEPFGIDSRAVVRCKPTARAIAEAATGVLAMSDTEQYELATRQHALFMSASRAHNNYTVLGNLGTEIANCLEGGPE